MMQTQVMIHHSIPILTLKFLEASQVFQHFKKKKKKKECQGYVAQSNLTDIHNFKKLQNLEKYKALCQMH